MVGIEVINRREWNLFVYDGCTADYIISKDGFLLSIMVGIEVINKCNWILLVYNGYKGVLNLSGRSSLSQFFNNIFFFFMLKWVC